MLSGPESGGDPGAGGLVGGLIGDARRGLQLLNDVRWAHVRTQLILYGMLLVPLASWVSLGWATFRTFVFSRGRAVA